MGAPSRQIPRLASVLPALVGIAVLRLPFPTMLLAQDPATSPFVTTLTGVVVDATTGTGVSGASVTLVDGRGGAITDSLGVFRIAAVPFGPWLFRVDGFGYEEVLLPVTVKNDMSPLEVQLQPSPIALEGIEVTGEGRQAALSGVVLDAVTGEGIPFAALWLRDQQRFASDGRGAFRLSSVPPGSYLLLAQRMGYEGLYVHVRVGAETEPVIVRLRPDPVVLEGIMVVNRRFRSRRNAYPRTVMAYGEDRLRRSGASDAMMFLQTEAFLGFKRQPRVWIDEQYIICGLDVLSSYHPSQLYLVEVYNRGAQIRAYTHEFVEGRARRPRMIEPADLPPPGLPPC